MQARPDMLKRYALGTTTYEDWASHAADEFRCRPGLCAYYTCDLPARDGQLYCCHDHRVQAEEQRERENDISRALYR